MFDIKQWGLTWIIGFSLVTAGYFYGVTNERAKHKQEVTLSQLSSANSAIIKLSEAATNLSVAQASFTEGVLNDKDKLNDVLTSVHTGVKRLSIPTKRASTQSCSASAVASNGEVRTELSGSASDFLVGEAGRADKVVRALALCQISVIELQKVCNQ